MTDFVDKILILLLILMLPISVVLTSTYRSEADEKSQLQAEEVKLQKIDQALDQIKTTVASDQQSKTLPIEIASVTFASASGELKVKGKAPLGNLNVMVSAVVLPAEKLKPLPEEKTASGSAETEDEEAVLGDAVEVVAVKPNEEGEFAFVKKVDPDEVSLIELRLEQADSEVTIQYNLLEGEGAYDIFSSEN